MAGPHFLFDTKMVVYTLFTLHLFSDCWLAYKTTLVTCMAITWLTFLQLSFKSGRPFWDYAEISSNGHCYYSFAGPSQSAFTMTFFWPYVIIMFLFKYYKSPNKCVNWCLIFVLLLTWVDIYLFTYINGLNYIYQLVIGQLTAFCYLVATLVFDNEVHRYTLRTGFSIRSSRARKFYLFFFMLGLFVAILIYYYSLDGTWNMPQNWVVNANY